TTSIMSIGASKAENFSTARSIAAVLLTETETRLTSTEAELANSLPVELVIEPAVELATSPAAIEPAAVVDLATSVAGIRGAADVAAAVVAEVAEAAEVVAVVVEGAGDEQRVDDHSTNENRISDYELDKIRTDHLCNHYFRFCRPNRTGS